MVQAVKRLILIASLMAGTLHGGAVIGQMTPAYTPSPVIPSTVVAGQLVTVRFDVTVPSGPVYWALAFSSITDVNASGSWDWVSDEDGAFGVSKSSMKAACPTPGVSVASPLAGNPNPVYAPFVVPDYGPLPVTMAFHVRARNAAQSSCNADQDFYRVVVVNPAPTATVTPTSTRTPTGGPSMTSSSTPTVGVASTSMSTPVVTTVPATSVPTPQGPATPMLRVAVPVPNPGPSSISFYVDGVADKVTVEFYTYGYTKVGEMSRNTVGGWGSVPMPQIGHGGFLAKVTAWQAGAPTSFKMANIYCL